MPQPRRTKHFIDANVQGVLARRIVVHWLAFLSVAFLVSFILQVLSNPFRPISAHLQDVWFTHGPFLLVMFFLLPVFVVDSIKLSHRFAGPIFSLRRAIREIAAGHAPRKLKVPPPRLLARFGDRLQRHARASSARSTRKRTQLPTTNSSLNPTANCQYSLSLGERVGVRVL